MPIEKEALISILKQTRNNVNAQVDHVAIDARIPRQELKKMLARFASNGLIDLHRGFVAADTGQRICMAVQAVTLGADMERTCSFLDWKEFENMVTVSFEASGYVVYKNLHFRRKEKRWQIDVLAFKEPIILSVDCKHWHYNMSPSRIREVAEAQVERTLSLANVLPDLTEKLHIACWKRAVLIPMILSLTIGAVKFCEQTPIVSILQLRDFLDQLPAYTHSLTHTCIDLSHGRLV